MPTPESFADCLGLSLLDLYRVDKYLYNVAARLHIVEGPERPECPEVRGYTNGVRIFLTPAWMLADRKTKLTTVTHEVLHVVFKHLIRVAGMPNIDRQRMNVAADLSIMAQQMDLGQDPPIKDIVPNSDKYKYLDLFTIYDMLSDDTKDNLGHPDVDPNASQESSPDNSTPGNAPPPPSSAMQGPSQEDVFAVDSAIQQAAAQAESEGYSTALSKSCNRQVNEMRATPIRWDRHLKQITSKMRSDLFSWSRPNRRMLSQVYLPSRRKKEIFEATMAVDVSGSVGQAALNQILAISQDILTKYVSNLHLLTFDDKIVGEWELTRKDKIVSLEINGYGGTYVDVVIKHLTEQKKIPKLLVIATDGYIPETKNPGYPVVWVIVDNPHFKSDYGTILHVKSTDYD